MCKADKIGVIAVISVIKLALVFLLFACSAPEEPKRWGLPRFEFVHEDNSCFRVVRDNETGREYLLYNWAKSSAMCPLIKGEEGR